MEMLGTFSAGERYFEYMVIWKKHKFLYVLVLLQGNAVSLDFNTSIKLHKNVP